MDKSRVKFYESRVKFYGPDELIKRCISFHSDVPVAKRRQQGKDRAIR